MDKNKVSWDILLKKVRRELTPDEQMELQKWLEKMNVTGFILNGCEQPGKQMKVLLLGNQIYLR